MTKRDIFGKQCNLIDDIKALFDNNELYNLTLDQLESLHEEIEATIQSAIENAKEF